MLAVRLFAKLILYYLIVAAIVALLLWLFPMVQEYLPVGRVQTLISQAPSLIPGDAHRHGSTLQLAHLDTLGGSLVWLVSAMLGALLTALPVSWVYMAVRNPEQYDQSLIGTIVMMPIVITSIVVIVQDSLALSFSLAGIMGAARFRNSMKSSGDLLFTLVAVAIGLCAGIGAMELAVVTTVMFNLCFLGLWATEYGERPEMKRYLSDFDPNDEESRGIAVVGVAAVAMTAAAGEAKD